MISLLRRILRDKLLFRILSFFVCLAAPLFASDANKILQENIIELGMNIGAIDGVIGPKTKIAIRKIYEFYDVHPERIGAHEFIQAVVNRTKSTVPKIRIGNDIYSNDFDGLNLSAVKPEHIGRPFAESKYNRIDIDSDGTDEIVVTTAIMMPDDKTHDRSALARPYILSFKSAGQSFSFNEQLSTQLDHMHYPRRLEVFDNPANGRKNFIIADYGLDGKNNEATICDRGGRNKWYEFDGTQLVNKSDQLPDVYDTTHDLRVNDLNQDGSPDIMVINDPMNGECSSRIQIFKPYFLISKGLGLVMLSFEDVGINPNKLYLSGYLFNSANGERYVILTNDGEHDGKSTVDIYKATNEASFKLKLVKSFNLPNKTLGNDIASFNFGAEANKRIIISNAYDGWLGNQITILKLSEDGWKQLALPLPGYNTKPRSAGDNGWCKKIFVQDLDDNGYDDLICSTREQYKNLIDWRPPIIMFYRDGAAYPRAHLSSLTKLNNLTQISLLLINGKPYLTGFKYINEVAGVHTARRHYFGKIDPSTW